MPPIPRLIRDAARGAAVVLAATGCAPAFEGDACQRLKTVFTLARTFPADRAELAYSGYVPGGVETRRRLVRVSGRLTVPPAAARPPRVRVEASGTGLAAATAGFRAGLVVAIAGDGGFAVSHRLAANLGAAELLEVTITPEGGALPRGTRIELCVDLARNRADLRQTPPCAGPGAPLAAVQAGVFDPRCTSCHGGVTPAAGLGLEAGRSHRDLVGVPSRQRPELARVEPGRPEASYLMKKLRGDADILGHRMPPPPDLSPAQIALVADWIRAGARDN